MTSANADGARRRLSCGLDPSCPGGACFAPAQIGSVEAWFGEGMESGGFSVGMAGQGKAVCSAGKSLPGGKLFRTSRVFTPTASASRPASPPEQVPRTGRNKVLTRVRGAPCCPPQAAPTASRFK